MLQGILFAVLLVAPDGQAFLGISTAVWTGTVEIDGRTFSQGLKIGLVIPNSGAAAAGVQRGDILVAIDGAAFEGPAAELPRRLAGALAARKVGDTIRLTVYRERIEKQAHLGDGPCIDPDAWGKPDTIVSTQPIGTTLMLTATRRAALLELEATLGGRPARAPGGRAIPPNEAIYPGGIEHLPVERLADALLADSGPADDYRVLRRRLAGLVNEGDSFRLHRVACAMREPFALASLSREVVDLPDSLPAALVHAARCLDRPIARDWRTDAPPLRTGLTADEHARQIERVLAAAEDAYRQAFAGLSDEDQAFLKQALPDVTDSFREVVMVLSDPDRRRLERVRRFVELARKVDVAKLVEAAVTLSVLTDADYLRGLAEDLADQGAGVILRRDTAFGPIIFAGHGDTWFREAAAVLIDLGGCDRYTHATQQPVSVVIDLGGHDTYQATFDGAQGAGVLAVSLLYDRDGDDTYISQQWAQGSGALGVGVLWDGGGNDSYRAADYSQAAAFCGVGLLLDDAGDDRYDAPRYAQALGMPGGFGALRDRGGCDCYYCSGRDLTNYGTPGVFDAFGQGCGIGFRGLASGGIAILRDDGGDDVYFGGNFAQGGGYYFGWGVLMDGNGDDRYLGSRYAQAWAAHQAVGYLEDVGGDDFYECWRTVGQSCSWDETVTMLLERAGNDVYAGPRGFARAAAHNNGWALLVDYAGQDRYEPFGEAPRADGNEEVTSFSLLLDLGGGEDEYAGGNANNTTRHGNRHGFFVDAPGDLDAALSTVGPDGPGTSGAGPEGRVNLVELE